MDAWYSVGLGNEVESIKHTNAIHDAFSPIFVASGLSKEIAVFSKYDRSTNIVTAYFTPKAHDLAALFKAKKCEKPTSDGIKLEAGDASALSMFFPDRKTM